MHFNFVDLKNFSLINVDHDLCNWIIYLYYQLKILCFKNVCSLHNHYNKILEQIHANNKHIQSIKTSEGTVTTEPEAIKQSFTLYQQIFELKEVNADTQDKNLKLIKADDEDHRKIDTPISKEDIRKAINGLKINKALGPDGLTN